MRIKGNSLRLRVSRSELARLEAGERVVELTRLGPSPDSVLSYSLKGEESAAEVSLNYQSGRIGVVLPGAGLHAWSGSDEVGIYAMLKVGNGESLEVAVEKDYACLDRSAADNEDTFANPHAGKAC
ncbi:MAG: hypothetical protein ABR976_05320 [Terracidiphilus sp.]